MILVLVRVASTFVEGMFPPCSSVARALPITTHLTRVSIGVGTSTVRVGGSLPTPRSAFVMTSFDLVTQDDQHIRAPP